MKETSKLMLEALFAQFGLSCKILSIRSAEIIYGEYKTLLVPDKATIILYWNDIDDGSVIRPPSISDTLYISTYAGTEPLMI